jgi:hypothetical protein
VETRAHQGRWNFEKRQTPCFDKGFLSALSHLLTLKESLVCFGEETGRLAGLHNLSTRL